jgi:hypothetical protein
MIWFWQKKKPEVQLDLDDDKVLLMATTSLLYYTQCHQMNLFRKRSFIKYLKIRGTIADNAVRGTVKSLAEAHTDKVELESSIRGLFKVKPKLLPLCLGISSEADELVSKILSE